jgi:hypothetical protein
MLASASGIHCWIEPRPSAAGAMTENGTDAASGSGCLNLATG